MLGKRLLRTELLMKCLALCETVLQSYLNDGILSLLNFKGGDASLFYENFYMVYIPTGSWK